MAVTVKVWSGVYSGTVLSPLSLWPSASIRRMDSVGSPKDWQNSTTLYDLKSQLTEFFSLSVNNSRLHAQLKGNLTNLFYLGLYHL
jgi:hypothetical protein